MKKEIVIMRAGELVVGAEFWKNEKFLQKQFLFL
jgi:hypothetical protein